MNANVEKYVDDNIKKAIIKAAEGAVWFIVVTVILSMAGAMIGYGVYETGTKAALWGGVGLITPTIFGGLYLLATRNKYRRR